MSSSGLVTEVLSYCEILILLHLYYSFNKFSSFPLSEYLSLEKPLALSAYYHAEVLF